jgi:hypothetical protein
MLYGSGDSRHPYFVSHIRGKNLDPLSFTSMLGLGFFLMHIIRLMDQWEK